ncbi:hypothetical protein XOC_4551 [Xanthomonas oryzae pv. oryzicola BLS256]|uniref:Uncharacterized protein n=1 Tax=Xanthomonas oryzae pv. oryzicola (strain BLS256) TaxID=383407 RepID=G7TBA2_XANOB|nr:hypothetical protein XOC_4551 [Xanthomonas oryzae pv. oryzicola BLS256]QEO95167.1 hypothetical protein XOCgx_0171 [Xanthomonas oryzae pv. oryzicola]
MRAEAPISKLPAMRDEHRRPGADGTQALRRARMTRPVASSAAPGRRGAQPA